MASTNVCSDLDEFLDFILDESGFFFAIAIVNALPVAQLDGV